MKFLFVLTIFTISSFAYGATERELIMALKTKPVMDAFRDRKSEDVKMKVIEDFIKSMKPLCLSIAKVKWNEIPKSEIKRMDKEVGVFIGGMSDYQIKFNADEKATLSSQDRSEVKKICKEIEKKSLN